jgi:ADP-heptose:LPS heptosyltransferase
MSALGDVAMALPVLKAVTENYPNLRLTLLTRGKFAPVFGQLSGITVFDAQVNGRHKGLLGLWRLYSELRTLGIGAVADLHNVLRSNILKLYFTAEAIPFCQIDKGRSAKNALTSPGRKVFKPLETTHQRYANVFDKLGYPVTLSKVALLPRQPMSDNARELAGKEVRKWIGIAPFAAFPGKTYPEHLMRNVIEGLSGTGAYTLLLFGGGRSEREALESWAQQYPCCINVAGKLVFEEELGLISNLDLMLSMDSANAHLAANYGIPTLTLWGLTHPFAGFYPFGQDPENALLADREKYPAIPTSVYGNKMPKGYEGAMESILPADVVRKVNQILSRT